MANLQLSFFMALSFIAIIHAGPVPIEFEEAAPEIRETCLKQSGVKLELVEQAVNGIYTEDGAFKCYIKCVFDQFRLISKNGFNFKAFATLSPPRFKKPLGIALKKCTDTTYSPGKENDLCDLAYNVQTCIYNIVPDVYFLI